MKFKCPSRLLLCKKLLFQKIKHPLWLNTFKGRYFTSHRHNHCTNWKINIWSIFSGSKVTKLHGTIKYNVLNIQNASQSARAIEREQSQQGLGIQPSPSCWVFREFAATQNRHVQQCSHTQYREDWQDTSGGAQPQYFLQMTIMTISRWHFVEDMATS